MLYSLLGLLRRWAAGSNLLQHEASGVVLSRLYVRWRE